MTRSASCKRFVSGLTAGLAAWLCAGGLSVAQAAETITPSKMSKTRLVINIDAAKTLAIQSGFRERPPTLEIRFHDQQLIASLPERSVIGQGIIETIAAQYKTQPVDSSAPGRVLQSLQIGLSLPCAYRVWSEPGRVVVEIEHPASVLSTAMEVGLKGGTIIHGASASRISERFRAMQKALAEASTRKPSQSIAGNQIEETDAAVAPPPAPVTQPMRAAPSSPASTADGRTVGVISARPMRPSPWVVIALFLGIMLITASAAWAFVRWDTVGSWWTRTSPRAVPGRLPSGVVLIDQLVWRAFERQGYQLVLEKELTHQPLGTFRVMAKDGFKAGLLFVGHGPFFEKQTVERFAHCLSQSGVEPGFLVASGSFTVPAQRVAKERRITLIGREQLIELMGAGASSESFSRQLEQQQVRLQEAQDTLAQHAAELEALRRQRNEASWHLGEERARSARLDMQLEELHQQLRQQESDVRHWEQEAVALRKQWEESEWYLGESRAQARHLSDQVQALQALADQLRQEVQVLKTIGERRAHERVVIPSASVELLAPEADDVRRSGWLRNLSDTGLGLEADTELPTSIRLRLLLPDQDPIESSARRVWQQANGASRYHSGYRFDTLMPEQQARLTQAIQSARSS